MPRSRERWEQVQRDYQRLLALVGLLVLVAIVSGWLSLDSLQNRLLASTGEQLALTASAIAGELDYELSQRYGELRVLLRTLERRPSDPTALRAYLDNLAERYRLCCWIGVTDGRGIVLASTERATISQDVSASAWFHSVRDGHGTVMLDFRATEPLQGRPMVAFSAPLREQDGSLSGAVTLHVGYPEFERIITRMIQTVEQHYALSHRLEWALLNKDGDLINESLNEETAPVNLRILGLPSATSSLEEGPSYAEETHLRRKVPVITGFAGTRGYGEFPNPHWRVLVRLAQSDVEAPSRQRYWSFVMGIALVFTPILAVPVWLASRLRREWARALTQEERWELMLDSIEDAVITVGRHERISYLNPSAERLLGLVGKDAEGQLATGLMRMIDRESRRPIENPLGSVLRSGEVAKWPYDAVLQSLGGGERILQGSVAPLRDAEGEVSGAIMVLHDVTEHQMAHEARARLSAIVESSDDAIIGKTLDGTITSWNHGAERIYGYSAQEVIGRHITLLFPPDRPNELVMIHERLRRGESIDHYQTVRIRKDGRAIRVSVNLSPIKDDQGRIVGAASIARYLGEIDSVEGVTKQQG